MIFICLFYHSCVSIFVMMCWQMQSKLQLALLCHSLLHPFHHCPWPVILQAVFIMTVSLKHIGQHNVCLPLTISKICSVSVTNFLNRWQNFILAYYLRWSNSLLQNFPHTALSSRTYHSYLSSTNCVQAGLHVLTGSSLLVAVSLYSLLSCSFLKLWDLWNTWTI